MVERQSVGGPVLYKENTRPRQGEPGLPDRKAHFEITVAGHLDEQWAERLGGLSITHDPQGNTRLSGAIPDQAALHGLLVQIRDLGLTLVSLQPTDH